MATPSPQPLWRTIQRRNFINWKDLVSFLQLEENCENQVLRQTHFPLNLPQRIARKMEKNNWNDPLLLQFLPTQRELEKDPAFSQDPVHDENACKTPKLLQKYHGRALLLCTGACAMHCRFCFRQHFNYENEDKSFDAEIALIAQDPSLSEIILSGGDPLSLSDQALGALIQKLSAIAHLKRLRFHTRFPIGIPERIDTSFLSLLSNTRLQVFFVIHCNHARELDEDILTALKSVQKLGCPVLCQSVLLKGVNDDLKTLLALCERLTNAGILPYTINQLDRVQGAKHFEVPLQTGLALMQALRAHISGYAVPSFVSEVPFHTSKLPLTLHALERFETQNPKSAL